MGDDNKVLISFSDVSVHNNPKDCWLIINAKGRRSVSYQEKGVHYKNVSLLANTAVASSAFVGSRFLNYLNYNFQFDLLKQAYDVTKFLEDHPGGEEVLLEVAGEDASEEFEAAGHGSAARLMLDEYYVGEIDPSSTPVTKPVTPVIVKRTVTSELPKKDEDDNKSSNFIIKLFLFLAVLGLAIAIRFYV